jgi:uncharacterized membrane protein YqjE
MSYDTRPDFSDESGRSIGELFRQLSRDFGTLLRQEVELARTELRHKVAQVARAAGAIGGGALLVFAGLLTLLQAAVVWLAAALDSPALAALIVGVVVLLAGAGLIVLGRNRLKAEELLPRRTVESLRQDAELAAHATTGNDSYPRNARRSV